MKRKRKKRYRKRQREFVGSKVQAAQCQLGIAAVAGGIIGLFVEPADGMLAFLALVPVGIGCVLLYYGTTRPLDAKENR